MKNNKRKEEKLEEEQLAFYLKNKSQQDKTGMENSEQQEKKPKAMFYRMMHALCTSKQLTVNKGFQGQEEVETNPFFKERSQ